MADVINRLGHIVDNYNRDEYIHAKNNHISRESYTDRTSLTNSTG